MIKEFFKKLFKITYNFLSTIFFLFFLAMLLLIGFIFAVIIFKGKIYIEIIIIGIIIYMFLFWKIWLYRSRKKLLKKYKPENDLARLAEESRKKSIEDGKTRKGGTFNQAIARTTATAGDSNSGVGRLGEFEERQLLQKADVDDAGENRKGIRKFLRRRKGLKTNPAVWS